MMTAYNPVGYVMMNQRGPDLGWFTDHAQQAKLLTTTFLDMNREAGDFQHATGCPYTVSRIYTYEPHANTQDLTAIRNYAHDRYDDLRRLRDDAQNGNVLFQVNNEQGFRRDDFWMYKFMAERAVALGDIVGMVFWNGASGSVTTGFWGQPNQWAEDYAIEYLRTMHELRYTRLANGSYAFLHGVHGYTSQYPLIAVNAGQDRKGAHDTANLWDLHNKFLSGDLYIDWRLAQDHLGRNYQGIMKALGWQPTVDGHSWEAGEHNLKDSFEQPVMCPWILMTEAGFDNMNDVRQVHWDDLVFMADNPTPEWAKPSMAYALALELPKDTLQVRNLLPDDVLLERALTLDLGVQSVGLDTPRGWRSLEKTWAQEDWFPGVGVEDVYAYCLRWQHQVIYQPTGVHIGQQVFSLGDTSGPNFWWVSFNLWDTGEGRARANDFFADQAQTRLDIAPHFLAATNDDGSPDGWFLYTLNGVSVHVRAGAGLSSQKLALVPAGAQVGISNAPAQMADGYEWRKVRYNDVTGWMALVVPFAQQFTPVGDVPSETVSVPRANLEALAANLGALAAMFNDADNLLQKAIFAAEQAQETINSWLGKDTIS